MERLLRASERAMQPLIFARCPGVTGETMRPFPLCQPWSFFRHDLCSVHLFVSPLLDRIRSINKIEMVAKPTLRELFFLSLFSFC